MTIQAAGSNYLNIMNAVMATALTATFTNPIVATKQWLLPFPTELGATPHLTVRYPDFRGWGNPRTTLPITGAQYGRPTGSTPRWFIYRVEVIVIYDYKSDSTAVTTVENALADLYGPFGLEVTFQENPNPGNSAESRVVDLKCVPGPLLGISIADRPLWVNRLTLEVADPQKVDYTT